MWPAFPTSEYYGGSATPRCQQRALRLPADRLAAGREGRHRVASHVHCVPFDGLGAQLHPDGIARTAHRSLGPGLRLPISYRQPERVPISYRHLSAAARPIHQSWQAADDSRGFFHWFALAAPLRLVCGHPLSGGANGPLRCQNCSRPRPQSRVWPVLNFSRPLRGPTAEPFHLRTELQRLVAHRRSRRHRSGTGHRAGCR